MTEQRKSFFHRAINEAKRRLQANPEIEKALIAKYLPKNAVIVEAGAHVGLDTMEMSKLWPDSTIYAFEPVPEIFDQLKKNVSGYKNIKVFNVALSNITGECKMFVSSGLSDGSSSLLKPKDHLKDYPGVYFEKEITVKTVTVEDWAKQQGLSKIDFFWLDLQGHELNVLKTAADLIKNTSVIYTEVSFKETYEGATQFRTMKNWLSGYGFNIKAKKTRLLAMGNILFVNRNNVA